MAAPITHIVVASRLFETHFSVKNRRDLLIGTSFPDIRYLGVLDRDKTHFDGLRLEDLKDDDSFMTGMKLHSILDIAGERYRVENDMYRLCPESPHIIMSVKILEDEVLYPLIKDWSTIRAYFDAVLPAEKALGVEESMIRRWHSILQRYFRRHPDDSSISDLLLSLGLSQDSISEIIQNVSIMRRDERLVRLVRSEYDDCETFISSPRRS
jgi:hypothetical protein